MTDRTAAGLRRQIERTGRQLGSAAGELMARADVRGRVGARAADLLDRAGAVSVQLRSTASQARRHLRGRAGRPGRARDGRASRASALAAVAQMPSRRAAHTARTAHPTLRRTARTAHITRAAHPLRAAHADLPFALRRPRPAVLAGAAAVTLVAAGAIGRSRVRR
ncbi:circumsporozoite protein [Streptomyces sp. NPDC012616]|uniref:circumsporozoite protein n=1 Tax=Streptomyces sp. NPDC012616 TaxID=3364840 RepID=UPI0036E26919